MSFAAKVQGAALMMPTVDVSAPESPIRARIHDASSFEWITVIPLPDHGKLPYTIEVEFEVPASAMSWGTPWERLETFTRLDGASGALPSADATVDILRRAAVAVTQMLMHARRGFDRHCRSFAKDDVAVEQGHTPAFLTIWLNGALRVVREARTKLAQSTALDTPLSTRERELIDELVSAQLLEMLADADRVLQEVTVTRPELARAPAFVGARRSLSEAVRDEAMYRTSRRFVSADASSPASLERYVTQMAQLEAHFEDVFLDRETRFVDDRLRQSTAIVAALLAGMVAFALELVLRGRLPQASQAASGIAVLVMVTGIVHAMRDRIKEVARAWLTGKVYRYHAQRTSLCRAPGRRPISREPFIVAREWCNHATRTLPDPLNPQLGASLPTTLVEYVQKGVLACPTWLVASGAKGIRHVFRYDLSTVLSQLHDEMKQVPVIEPEDHIRFVDVPRRYRVPLLVRLRYDEQHHEKRVTLVLDKRGLRRVEQEAR
jgi:hypothetical protein